MYMYKGGTVRQKERHTRNCRMKKVMKISLECSSSKRVNKRERNAWVKCGVLLNAIKTN
jgi:hypothetical protein